MSEALNLLTNNVPSKKTESFKVEIRPNNRENSYWNKKTESAFSKVLSNKAQKISEIEAVPEVDDKKALERLSFLANLNMHKQLDIANDALEQTLGTTKVDFLEVPADITLVKPKETAKLSADLLVGMPLANLPKVDSLPNIDVEANNEPNTENTPVVAVANIINTDLQKEIAKPEKVAVQQEEIIVGSESELEQQPKLETLPANKIISTETTPVATNAKVEIETNTFAGEKMPIVPQLVAETDKTNAKIVSLETTKLANITSNPTENQVLNLEKTTAPIDTSIQKLEQVILGKLDTTSVENVKPPINVSFSQAKVLAEQEVKNVKMPEKSIESSTTSPIIAGPDLAVGAQTANNNPSFNLDFSQNNLGVVLEKTVETSSDAVEFKANLDTTTQNATVELTEDKLRTARQLVENVRLLQKAGNTEMMIRLKPEHLGEMVLKISIVNGSVNANFHTNNVEARGILEAAMPQLRQELSHSGFKVHDVGVYAGLGEFMSKKDGQDSLAYSQKQKQPNLQKINNTKLTETELQQLQDQGVTVAEGIDYKI